jgi:hypothetical protein
MPAHAPTQLKKHLLKRAAAGSSHASMLMELRRYRDRLRPHEYQELVHYCRTLAAQRDGHAHDGN